MFHKYDFLQSILRKIMKASSVAQGKRPLISVLVYFLNTGVGNWSLQGGLRAGLCSNVAFRFWFPYFQSLWGISYLKFLIVDTKFHFTCGEQTVYVKLQGIIQRIVGSKSCNWPFSTTILNMVMSLTRKIQYRN